MTSLHSDLVTTNLHRAFHYEQDADPGAVGAGKYWLDTNSGPPRALWRRNAGDSGWDSVGTAASAAPASQLDANGTTLDVNVITDGEYLKRVGATVVSGTPAGGSGIYNPFEPLVSPNAMDDEFNDGSGMSGSVNGLDPKWAWRNQSTSAITFPNKGVAKLAVPAASSGNFRLLEQAVAAGNFEFVVFFSLQAVLADLVQGGLCVIDRTNGDFYVLQLNAGSTGTLVNGTSITVARWTNVTTFDTNLAAFAFGPTGIWMRIKRVGSTLSFSYSTDGQGGWVQVASFTDTVNVNGVALAMNETNNTGLSAGFFRAFRRLV